MKVWQKRERRRIDFEDDVVIVYDKDDNVIYQGMEDYEPMKREDWKWNQKLEVYELTADKKKYIKICLDI